MMRFGRVSAFLVAVICMHTAALYAQDTQSPPQAQQTDQLPASPAQALTVPALPNTCRGAEKVNAFLHEIAACLSESKHIKMKVGEIGLSQRRVPILMVTITGIQKATPGTGGLMVIARQHGNEPAGTRAALELIRSFAIEDEPMAAILGDLTLRIVPVANPDGMDLFQRRTANGRDMNRDWNVKHLPETRAVDQAIRIAQPQVLMDLHELTPGDRDRAFVLGIPGSKSAHLLSAVKTGFMEHGLSVSTRTTEHYSTTGLLHRHFVSRYGGTAFLVESKYTGDPVENLKARSEYHLSAVMGVLGEMGR